MINHLKLIDQRLFVTNGMKCLIFEYSNLKWEKLIEVEYQNQNVIAAGTIDDAIIIVFENSITFWTNNFVLKNKIHLTDSVNSVAFKEKEICVLTDAGIFIYENGKECFSLKLKSLSNLASNESFYAVSLNSKDNNNEDADSILLFNGEQMKLFKTTQPIETLILLSDKMLVKYFDGSLQVIGKKKKSKFRYVE